MAGLKLKSYKSAWLVFLEKMSFGEQDRVIDNGVIHIYFNGTAWDIAADVFSGICSIFAGWNKSR